MPTLVRNVESKKRCAKREKRDAKYTAIHFSFFAFPDHSHVFCDKCIGWPYAHLDFPSPPVRASPPTVQNVPPDTVFFLYLK